jgi:hypothetical protein
MVALPFHSEISIPGNGWQTFLSGKELLARFPD